MDTQRLMLKIRELENYTEEIHELIPESKEEYLKSLKTRRAIERQLQIMIECVIDIAILLIKALKLTVPTDEASIFEILKPHLSIPKKLNEMKGFRNILVHRYGEINNERVYRYVKEDLDDFHIFLEDAKKIIGTGMKSTESAHS